MARAAPLMAFSVISRNYPLWAAAQEVAKSETHAGLAGLPILIGQLLKNRSGGLVLIVAQIATTCDQPNQTILPSARKASVVPRKILIGSGGPIIRTTCSDKARKWVVEVDFIGEGSRQRAPKRVIIQFRRRIQLPGYTAVPHKPAARFLPNIFPVARQQR